MATEPPAAAEAAPTKGRKWSAVKKHAKSKGVAKRWYIMSYTGSYWDDVHEGEAVTSTMSLDKLAKVLLKRAPWYIILYACACIYIFQHTEEWSQDEYAYRFWDEGDGMKTTAWYTPITATFLHNTPAHLWQNMGMLAVGGFLLEITEGHLFGARPLTRHTLRISLRRDCCTLAGVARR